MIQKKIHTRNKPVVIKCNIGTPRKGKVRIIAYNPQKRGAVYLDRWKTIQNNERLDIRLPHSSEFIIVKIIPMQQGLQNIKLNKLKVSKLNQVAKCYKVGTKTKEFIQFAKEFSDNLAILHPGTYYSDKKRFRIDLFDIIKNEGRISNTPSRISNTTGRIEVSKKHFLKFTIPMRISILLHEYSHFYLNKNQHDEIEADLNGLKLYLGMGYPYIEAHKSFLHTFMKNPSKENEIRYKYIKTFADNFEKLKYKIC